MFASQIQRIEHISANRKSLTDFFFSISVTLVRYMMRARHTTPLSASLGFIFSHASALSSYTFNFHHLFSTTNTVSLSLSPTHTHTLSHKGFIHNLSIYIVFLSPRCLAHSRRCLHPLVSPKVSENNSKWQISIRLLAHTHNTHTQAAARPLA